MLCHLKITKSNTRRLTRRGGDSYCSISEMKGSHSLLWGYSLLFFLAMKRSIWYVFLHFVSSMGIEREVLFNLEDEVFALENNVIN